MTARVALVGAARLASGALVRLDGLLPLFDEPLAPLRARIEAGQPCVLGAPDGAKPALAAALAQGRPVLVITGKQDAADRWAEELAAWLGDAERVLRFPESDSIPYERAGLDSEAARPRLALLHTIHHWRGTRPPVILAPVQALAQPTIAPEDLDRAAETIAVGQRVALEPFLRRVERLGYSSEALVESQGQVARRGGIVDIFPPDAILPLRVEFLGNAIESLRRFHPASQRTTERVNEAEIGPARELQPEPERAAALQQTLDFATVQAELRPRLEEELASLARGEGQGTGLYIPFLLHASLLDHLPPETLILLDEARDLNLLLEELEKQAAEARAALEREGRIPLGLPLPQMERTALFEAIRRRPTVEFARWAIDIDERTPPPASPPAAARREETRLGGGGERGPGDSPDVDAQTHQKREERASRLHSGDERRTVSPPQPARASPLRAVAGGGAGGGVRSVDDARVFVLPFAVAPSFAGRLRSVFGEVLKQVRGGTRAVVLSQQSGRLAELFSDEGMKVAAVDALAEPPAPGSLSLLHGSLSHGWLFELADGPLCVTTDAEIFGFTKQRRTVKARSSGREAFVAGLTPGDLVVHIEHGIARFAGLVRRLIPSAEGAPVEREFLELRYAEKDRLFVPTEQVDRVDRYVGPSDHAPSLTRLSSGEWARTKERVRRAVTDLAHELLALYAARETRPGHAFPPDTPWQQEMEAAFPYVETPDQLTALTEIKRDMEGGRPMDRVIVGDVGYGKTEVALRAAFKAVMDAKQVAVLAPTTVLAQQHLQTFRERVSGFPVRVDVLSRFRSDAEARAVINDAAEGKIDILIGTHRLLTKEMRFKDLGLVIIDEEQRFGVSHKERLKQLRAEVDVLTLSATPIPRTLHMSLTGIRDMSTMETAPEDRLPVKTYVSEWDDYLLREAILREIDRGGQIYFVHNRVNSIELIARRVRDLVPEASVFVGHGQMPEEALERTMLAFQRGEGDVLLCTTIIESGLDIPNANTIIINQANRLGLAQLYQLRGRVGRGAHRAYAYLFYDKNTVLTETAQKRLQTIFEAIELGAGFQIAMKDLEIRGAGNLLGSEQSGHIGAVGYELTAMRLGVAVQRRRAHPRGEPAPPAAPPAITVDLPLTAHIPDSYLPDLNMRLSLYQQLGQVTDAAAIDALTAEISDRFGAPPPTVENLLEIVRIKALARKLGLTGVTAEASPGSDGGVIVLRAPGPIARRELVAATFGEAVQVGSTLIRIDQTAKWRATLRAVLDRLDPESSPAASAKNPATDYGSFAPGAPGAGRRAVSSQPARPRGAAALPAERAAIRPPSRPGSPPPGRSPAASGGVQPRPSPARNPNRAGAPPRPPARKTGADERSTDRSAVPKFPAARPQRPD